MNIIRRNLGFSFFSMLLIGLANTSFAADELPITTQTDPSAATEAAPATAEAAVEPAAAPAVTAEPLARGVVARATFTSSVEEREPVDQLSQQSNDVQSLMFFTELSGLQDQTALHRWEYDGEVIAEVPFSVNGPRWRVWSSKDVEPEMLGTWTVSVVNGNGDVIASESIDYQQAASSAPVEQEQQTQAPAASSDALTATQ